MNDLGNTRRFPLSKNSFLKGSVWVRIGSSFVNCTVNSEYGAKKPNP